MNENITLFEYLKYKADDMGYEFYKFAIAMGLSSSTLYSFQHKKPSLRTYRKIAKFTKTDLNELRSYPIKKD